MKYKRCCACDFWVTNSDTRCPNCGILDPRSERSESVAIETPMSDGTRAAFGGFVGAVIGGFLMQGLGVAVGVAVGVSLGVLLGADREWAGPGDLAALARRTVSNGIRSLRQDEETIQQRLGDISSREKRLNEARQKVLLEAGDDIKHERWQHVEEALESAEKILVRQRERYHADLWEIALIRWQNTLEPLASDWESLTHDTCNHRLRLLEAARERGANFLRDWEVVDLDELPEAARCVQRLRDVLDSCDKLREALIVQQAALAVRGIAPMSDAIQAAHAPTEALHALDTFNARASIGEFSTAFGELEAEYSRLRSEEELSDRSILVGRAH